MPVTRQKTESRRVEGISRRAVTGQMEMRLGLDGPKNRGCSLGRHTAPVPVR